MSEISVGPVGDRHLPTSAWVFGWLCLGVQVWRLAERGLSRADGVWVLLSVVLTAAVVWWFAGGVLRARRGRVMVVWVLLGLGLLASVLAVSWLDVVLSAGLLVALGAYCSTDWFRHQRAHDDAVGWEIGGLLLIAVVVGCLGGITAPDQPTPTTTLRIGL